VFKKIETCVHLSGGLHTKPTQVLKVKERVFDREGGGEGGVCGDPASGGGGFTGAGCCKRGIRGGGRLVS